jgi:hypothetical protein
MMTFLMRMKRKKISLMKKRRKRKIVKPVKIKKSYL